MLSRPFDVAISQATYFDAYGRVPAGFRRKLWHKSLHSLAQSDLRGLRVVLVVCDDGSLEPPTEHELAMAGSKVATFYRAYDHIGFGPNLRRTVRMALPLARWVLWLDDDGLLHPQWVHTAQKLMHAIPNSLAYGLFNTKYHPTVKDHGWWVEKSYITELGTFFRSGHYCLEHDHSSLLGALCCQRDQPNRLWPCSRPSVVQHMGDLGYNNPAGDDYDPEFENASTAN